ncbi:hypothetical protein [Piscirickettsia salmonis]|uniref:hypothetical protein n=1 Tax=Piscirickettsia salmonis TaxID=1238 RepID=UPI003A802C80
MIQVTKDNNITIIVLHSGVGEGRAFNRKRRYLGRYFAHPMMQNRRAKRDDYKPSAALVTGHYVP